MNTLNTNNRLNQDRNSPNDNSVDNEQIIAYFIEEAKENLSILEKGLENLSLVVNDPERLNEMFRAAHSIKGGAAMLDKSSIQKTAHRLEDGFKSLQEYKITVDQKLQNLFLDIYYVLDELVKGLERTPFPLSETEMQNILTKIEPTCLELEHYLNQLVGSEFIKTTTNQVASANLVPQTQEILQEMLELFKQEQNPENRQELKQLCDRLIQVAPEQKGWQSLLQTAQTAIANPKHSYTTLAPVIIKELKQGRDLLAVAQSENIAPSLSLEQLAQANLPQILITVEPEAVATSLRQVFDQQQLSQLVQLLSKS